MSSRASRYSSQEVNAPCQHQQVQHLKVRVIWYQKWYHYFMSMNLRLSEKLAQGLKALAEETGKSQQVLAREAIAEYISNYKLLRYPPEIRHMIIPAEREFGEFYSDNPVVLPPGVTSEEILHELRKDRF